ncbi:MAG: 1-acyl-sn-glycerol-3-phosphate acyltransferase [Sphingobium sp.]|nr:1-acyl-sn-glycerol-3-phosphate acyltransferase [Sphingobium sp.]
MDKEAPFSRAVTVVRSLLFMLLFYGLTIPLLAAAVIACLFGSRAIGAVGELWARLHRLLAHVVLGQRVVVEGELPQNAQFIVIKHESMFETLDTICLFNRPIVAAKRELIQIPIWGWVAARYGLIAVDRKAGASALRAIRAQALEAMAKGRAVIFFPEGTRVPHGQAPALKAGFAGLYMVLGVPVVPIAVNSGKVSPRNSFIKRAGTITYRVGEPVPPGLPRAEAEARVHAAINALNDLSPPAK